MSRLGKLFEDPIGNGFENNRSKEIIISSGNKIEMAISECSVSRSNGVLEYRGDQFFEETFFSYLKNIFLNNDYTGGTLDINGIIYEIKFIRETESSRVYTIGNGVLEMGIVYDHKYNMIRFSESNNQAPINYKIDEDTIKIYLNNGELDFHFSFNLPLLIKLGITKNNLLGLENIDMSDFEYKLNKYNKFITSQNTYGITDLQKMFTHPNNIDVSNIQVISMNEFKVIDDAKELEGIYTYGAESCVIMMIIDRKSNKIGLGHINIDITPIRYLLNNFGSNREIYLIGGHNSVFNDIFDQLYGHFSDIKFLHQSYGSGIGHDAGIIIKDGKPQIIYGRSKELIARDMENYKN